MKTCYVSIPFGVRQDAQGRSIDFGRVYAELFRPALEQAGVNPQRADELTTSAVIHRSLFEAVLGSDVMVADLTTANPNVMYEVGLRHAARRSVTILAMASGTTIPFNLNLMRVLIYALGADGRPDPADADRFRQRLVATVREATTRVTSDSPVFEFFPDVYVELPEDLAAGARAARKRTGGVAAAKGGLDVSGARKSTPVDLSGPGILGPIGRSAAKAVDQGVLGAPDSKRLGVLNPIEQLRLSEQQLRASGTDEPFDYIALLRRYRDVSAWDDLIRAFESLPPEAARAPEAIQLTALALNRRGASGDRERAIDMVRQLIDETGGSAEAYGILGRIHKDRYEDDRRRGDDEAALRSLGDAIDAYLSGFELEPSEYYPGVNAVTLLMQRGTPEDRSRAEALIPRVREAVRLRAREGSESYWELATELELAVLEGSWGEASDIAGKIAATAPMPWMLQSTARQLRRVAQLHGDPSDNVSGVLNRLQSGTGLQAESR